MSAIWTSLSHRLGHLLPLADATRWRSMGSGFRGSRARFDPADIIAGILLVAAAAGGVYLLSRLVSRQEAHRRHYSPRALFRSLCRAHELDRHARRLLASLVRSQRLRHPARVFVEPHRFEPDALSPQLRQRAAELRALRDRLFQTEEGETQLAPRGR